MPVVCIGRMRLRLDGTEVGPVEARAFTERALARFAEGVEGHGILPSVAVRVRPRARTAETVAEAVGDAVSAAVALRQDRS